MTEFQAQISGLSFDLSGSQFLTLRLKEDGRTIYDAYKDKTLLVALKAYHRKRSNNANSLCWKLCTEIADVLKSSKEEVYLDMLKNYGQSEMISVRSEINIAGFVKYYEPAGETILNGKPFTHYKVFKGSSQYDTREMSIFFDGIVSEAKSLDIPVLSESEIALLKEEWK